MVGIGAAIHDTFGNRSDREAATYSVMLGTRTEQNLYTAELAAIAIVLRCLLLYIVGRQVTILTSSQAVLLAVSQPKH
jgi:hypothetical protein